MDVSLSSDLKNSSTSISKSIYCQNKKPKTDSFFKSLKPTPVRSSTSIENYASSSKPSLIDVKKLDAFKASQQDMRHKNSTNPYNSISCLSAHTDASQVIESIQKSMGKKLEHSVSSVGTQANLNSACSQIRKQEMESQILSIEIDLNKSNLHNGTQSSDDYVSVADLYHLANKKSGQLERFTLPCPRRDEAASVRVTDYSAFKNSLNFQLQAARAAALAVENKIDATNQSLNEEHNFLTADPSNSPLAPKLNGKNQMILRISSNASRNSMSKKTVSRTNSSSTAPYSTGSLLYSTATTNEPYSSSSDQINASKSSIESGKPNIFPNDLYMCLNSKNWSQHFVPADDCLYRPKRISSRSSPRAKRNSVLNIIYDSSNESNQCDPIKNGQIMKVENIDSKKNSTESLEGTEMRHGSNLWTTISFSTSSPSLSSSINDDSAKILVPKVKYQNSVKRVKSNEAKRQIYKINRIKAKSFHKKI